MKKSKMVTGLLLGPLLGGCAGANRYELSPDQVYAKLIALEHGTPSVINVGGVRHAIRGDPGRSVTWVTDYAHSYYECTAWLTPDAGGTSVNVGCDDRNAPAKFALPGVIRKAVIGSATDAIPDGSGSRDVRHRYIELVDSTLDGRPFDQARAQAKVVGWPDPPAPGGR